MRPTPKPVSRSSRRARRHLRVRKRVRGSAERPRLVVYRSIKHIYAQCVDDDRGMTLVGASDLTKGLAADGAGKVGRAKAVGKQIAVLAKKAGITRVVFDRGGYPYHGRVRAVAEGAREGGLEF